jgi:DNA-directed RNA polymerase specialized sigma24 family protein
MRDHKLTPGPEVIAHYRGWLYAQARKCSRSIPDHDDLVQEGRIAMLRAMATYDPVKGSLPSWLTGAARMRMREVAKRLNWTGTPMRRGHTRERPAIPADLRGRDDIGEAQTDSTGIDPRNARAAQAGLDRQAFWQDSIRNDTLGPDDVAAVRAAVARLSPSVRTAIFERFYLDQPTPTGRWHRAIPELRAALEHLRSE